MFIRRDEDDIDRIFRQRLKNAEEPFPGHLWEGIRQRSNRRRRIPPFWIVAAIMLTGALGFGLYQFDNHDAPLAQQTTITPFTQNQKDNATSSTHESTRQVSSPSAENTISAQQSSVEQIVQNKNTVENATRPESQNTTKSSIIPEKRHQTLVNTNENGIETAVVHSPSAHNVGEQSDVSSPETEATYVQPELVAPAFINPGESPSQAETVLQEVSNASASDNVDVTGTTTQPTTEAEDVAATPASTNGTPHEIPAESESAEYKLPKAPPTFSAASPFSLGVYAAGYQAHRLMTNNPDMGGTNYIPQDSASLTLSDGNAQGMAFGIGVQYAMSRWVYFSAGLEYSRMKEHTHYRDLYLVGTPTYVNQLDTSWFYTPTDTSANIGMTTVASDSIWHTSSKTATIFNTYQSLNVPVTAGLSLHRNRLFVGLEAGPVFRLGKMYSGKFRYDDQLLPNEASLADSPFAVPQIQEGRSVMLQEVYSKWNIDWHAALKLGYSITPHLSAQGGLQYRVMKNTIQHSDTGNHRMVMPGISLGLYYRF